MDYLCKVPNVRGYILFPFLLILIQANDNPDYNLEMAFRKLENKSQLPTKPKSRKNEDLSNADLDNLFTPSHI